MLCRGSKRGGVGASSRKRSSGAPGLELGLRGSEVERRDVVGAPPLTRFESAPPELGDHGGRRHALGGRRHPTAFTEPREPWSAGGNAVSQQDDGRLEAGRRRLGREGQIL